MFAIYFHTYRIPSLEAMRKLIQCLFLLLAVAATHPLRAEEPVRVFAAASLTNALEDIASAWAQAGHPRPRLAFAASSTLARQIEAGAPADVFASADQAWMDYLDKRGRLQPGTRQDLAGNALVMIVPRGRRFPVQMRAGFDLPGAFAGKLCTGEPGVVPVGSYARDALRHMGWWEALRARVVGADDVRTALAFVERGECALGIVYATDARISDKVEVVATFPAAAHAPIVYPFAAVKGARPEAAAFLRYLRTSPAAAAILRRHGFRLPGR